MWQSKREISRECNNIIGSAKGSQISEVGKGKRADVYLEHCRFYRESFGPAPPDVILGLKL
jgi:hypothetical protein